MFLVKEHHERRQRRRFKDFDEVCVLLRSQTNEETAFLVDLSREGASFEYILTARTFEKHSTIDIVIEDKNCCSEIISCNIIFDHEIDGEYYTPVKMRHLGVKFKTLTPKQLASLLCFINKGLIYPPFKAIQIY